MHKCDFLMSNRRVVIVKDDLKIASLTYLMDQNSSVNSKHFCHTEDVKNNRSSGLNILEKPRYVKFL